LTIMLHLGTAMSVLEIPIGEVAEASLPDAETRHQSKHEGRERGLHASAACSVGSARDGPRGTRQGSRDRRIAPPEQRHRLH
jgi:hypothetical protein